MSPLEIKDQGETDFCTGCVISSIAEQYVGEPCDESYSFAMGKKYANEDIKLRGQRPKDSIMGAIEYEVLPKRFSPYSIATHDRDFLADYKNWEHLRKHAVKPFRSFKKVRDIDGALENGTVFTGIYWQGEWNNHSHIFPTLQPHKYEKHEVRIIDEKNGCWIIQNSRGKEVGDCGLWYLPKTLYNYIGHTYIISPEPWGNILSKLVTIYLL